MTTPQDRQTSKPGSTRVPDPQAEAPAGPPTGTDPQAGLDREVGDLENPTRWTRRVRCRGAWAADSRAADAPAEADHTA